MYLHTLLNRNNKEITKKILTAQIAQPFKEDFCELVNKDIQMIKLEQTYEEIAHMKKSSLKIGGGDKWMKSKTVRWTPPGLFSG